MTRKETQEAIKITRRLKREGMGVHQIIDDLYSRGYSHQNKPLHPSTIYNYLGRKRRSTKAKKEVQSKAVKKQVVSSRIEAVKKILEISGMKSEEKLAMISLLLDV